jgi:adenosyl cobinamide kinase/adenosyl cobinamide phosphate guanylyltransferase
VTLVVLVGGARSGKSLLAVELGRQWAGAVGFIATAEAHDEEMRERIDRHRRERPDSWELIEEPLELRTRPLWRTGKLVIVDCLTLWVANLLEAGRDEDAIVESAEQLAATARARSSPTVVVSNEVGLGVIPATPLGRQFRDLLGSVNRVFVEQADRAFLVVAGRALPLEAMSLEDVLA